MQNFPPDSYDSWRNDFCVIWMKMPDRKGCPHGYALCSDPEGKRPTAGFSYRTDLPDYHQEVAMPLHTAWEEHKAGDGILKYWTQIHFLALLDLSCILWGPVSLYDNDPLSYNVFIVPITPSLLPLDRIFWTKLLSLPFILLLHSP